VERSWLTVHVARKRVEADNIVSFELVLAGGGELPAFSAGSHIDVEVRPGMVRQYSLCNPPGERDRYLIAVLREPRSRGGSVAMLDHLDEGQRIHISAPRNLFPLVGEARRIKLFAGGIGVTPILCMAERLANSGIPFSFHYANRSRSRAAFLERIRSSAFAGSVQFHFDDEVGGPMLDLQNAIGAATEDTHLYVCGPAAFIKSVLETAERAGWPSSQLHREYFVSSALEAAAPSGMFSVRIASTGKILTVPSGRTVVDVLAENGIEVPMSCQQGVCGTCVTRVLEGIPEHHDVFMTDEEHARNDQFTPCCSRSKTPLLVIDI
jgi:vanillate O-demethylase ferredoxin subunit